VSTASACDPPRPSGAGRKRDAAATRKALLAAARLHLAQSGFDGTTTREVAATAGVNQTLVYRYFGSKEALFREAADLSTHIDMLTSPLDELPALLVDRTLNDPLRADGEESPLISFITSVNQDAIRDLIRGKVTAEFTEKLATRLEGEDAELRAEVFAALVIGTGFLRNLLKTPAIAKADPEEIARIVTSAACGLLRP
jgi:AcrR family transcriptional regulator